MKTIELNTATEDELKSIAVGDSLIRNEIEWTVAEEPGSSIVLYREDIDGKVITLVLDRDTLIDK